VTWQVLVDGRARKELESLDESVYLRVKKAILKLGEEPRPKGTKKIKGFGEDTWRIRVGDYRVLYRIDDRIKAVIVSAIKHRREVYRKHH